MLQIRQGHVRAWKNYHRTIERPAVDTFALDGTPETGDPLATLAAIAALTGGALADARSRGVQFQPVGSTWSFSDLIHGEGRVLHTGFDGLTWLASGDMIGGAGASAHGRLVLAYGGTRIGPLNRFLAANDLSLMTSGAHDGQTIAGAMGTGTHGSAIGKGAFQNHVRGIHVVTGPGESRWIEPSGPGWLADRAARAIAATTVRDDALFNPLLVHLGGLGIVSAVLLEVAPAFGVSIVRRRHKLDLAALGLLREGAFERFARAVWPNAPAAPYFVQVIVNPHAPFDSLAQGSASDAMVTLMFDGPAPSALIEPAIDARHDPNDLIEDAVRARDGEELLPFDGLLYRAMLAAFAQTPASASLPPPVRWGAANPNHRHYPLGIQLYNAAYAIDRHDLERALTVMSEAFVRDGGAPAVFTLRFVSDAAGTLAFTRFPETVVINMDGPRHERCARAARRISCALEAAGIAFSQHWGKQGAITPNRLAHEYGDPNDLHTPAGKWRAARHHLINDAEMRRTLTNRMIERLGLA